MQSFCRDIFLTLQLSLPYNIAEQCDTTLSLTLYQFLLCYSQSLSSNNNAIKEEITALIIICIDPKRTVSFS